ncbi:hypothetical protein MCHUDSM44219_01074 [Mycolicibacterium chubuense]|uniref:Uncharacterized protein n=2 Tax=Mycolicibacterium chubuense TaxID=1800 RepID=A0A0J6WP32_MYCCU|nr:hypothetical protein MCHUDSM44219_01074 [Mycolicibacterium chubuense]SPX98063.1 Uncharacterised protein [Mycolicibacterium chubuense]
MADSVFTFWEPEGHFPPDWQDAFRRLDEADGDHDGRTD